MNPFLDDPNITAYVLGELSEDHAARLRLEAASNPQLSEAILKASADYQSVATLLASNYNERPKVQLSTKRKNELLKQVEHSKSSSKIVTFPPARQPKKKQVALSAFYVTLGTAAVLSLGLFSLSLIPSTPSRSQATVQLESPPTAAQSPVRELLTAQHPPESETQVDGKLYPYHTDPFAGNISEGQSSEAGAITPIAIEISSHSEAERKSQGDTASEKRDNFDYVVEKLPSAKGNARYHLAKRFLREGQFPPSHLIRYEEFINAYDYTNPYQNQRDHLAIASRVITSPWNPQTKLVAVLLWENAPVKNLSASLEINPEAVQSCRLLGYESTPQGRKGLPTLVDGSEMMIYEVTLTEQASMNQEPLLKVKSQWRGPQDRLYKNEHAVRAQGTEWDHETLTQDFKVAVTLAYFAHYLKSDLSDAHLKALVSMIRSMKPLDPSFASSYQMITSANSIVEFNSLKLAKPRIEVLPPFQRGAREAKLEKGPQD